VAMGEVIDHFQRRPADKLKAVLKKNFAKVEYLPASEFYHSIVRDRYLRHHHY